MHEIGYALIINYINDLMVFYLPAMCILTPRRGKKSVIWIAFSTLHTAWILLSHYVMEFSAVIYPLLYGLVVSAALLELFYRDSRKRKLALLVCIFLTGILADMTVLLCMRVLIPGVIEIYLKGQLPEAAVMCYLMGNLCSGILVMVEAIIYFCLIRTKQKRLFGAFLLLAAYQFVLGTGFFILCFDYTERVAQIGLAVEVFCSVVNVMMLYFLENILQRQDVEAKIKEQERLRRQEYAYFEAAGRSAEELRMIRHDFSNHLQAMYKMSDEAGDRETVKEMLEEMSRRIGRQEVDGEYGRKEYEVICRK